LEFSNLTSAFAPWELETICPTPKILIRCACVASSFDKQTTFPVVAIALRIMPKPVKQASSSDESSSSDSEVETKVVAKPKVAQVCIMAVSLRLLIEQTTIIYGQFFHFIRL
jgi:hypothetical protein